jgi:hypothetical protein
MPLIDEAMGVVRPVSAHERLSERPAIKRPARDGAAILHGQTHTASRQLAQVMGRALLGAASRLPVAAFRPSREY